VLAEPDWTYPATSAPRLIRIVELDGSVTTRTVPRELGRLALSPDGHSFLYASGPRRPPSFLTSRLRRRDLDTGEDRAIIRETHPVAWGWDSEGRIVALTATATGKRTGHLERVPLSGFVVWRGEVGQLTSAPAQATSTAVDVTDFLAADARTAYFQGMTSRGRHLGSTRHSVWRLDFAGGRLEGRFTLETRRVQMFASQEGFDAPLLWAWSPWTARQSWDFLATGLPIAHYVGVTREFARGPVSNKVLERVGLVRLSDMQVTRSIIVTPAPARADWGDLVFDAAFSRYAGRFRRWPEKPGQDPGPAVVAQVDVATGDIELITSGPDEQARPLCYVGSSGALVYRASHGARVGVYLKEPGAAPRLLLYLGRVGFGGYFPEGEPTVLGMRYER
jgi:hypothetical protein